MEAERARMDDTKQDVAEEELSDEQLEDATGGGASPMDLKRGISRLAINGNSPGQAKDVPTEDFSLNFEEIKVTY